MLVSWNWLSEYVDLTMSHDELVERLSMTGLNHEGTDTVGGELMALLSRHCADCHADTAPLPQAPYFASANPAVAYAALRGKVNLAQPEDSRLVTRLEPDFHNCWSDCAENADEMRMENGRVRFLSNRAGGVLGGISTGQDLVVRFAVKPTSSILTPRRSVDSDGEETEIVTKGRHDPCVGIRATPIVEAMMAIVLMDHALRHRAQVGF